MPEYEYSNGCVKYGNLLVGPRPDDDVLAWAYLYWKKDGTLSTVWATDPPGIAEYLEWLGKRDVIGCWRLDADVARFLGMGFISNVEVMGKFSKAEIGFSFVHGFSTIVEKMKLGRMMIGHVFREYGYDSLFGTTPTRNPAAVAYAKRLGFTMHGPIEGFCVWNGELSSVWISQMSRPIAP